MDKEDVMYTHTHTHTHTHIHIYTQYYLSIKKNKILPFTATWMDLEGIMLSEISQRERQISYDNTYMWNLKKYHKLVNITTTEKADSQI